MKKLIILVAMVLCFTGVVLADGLVGDVNNNSSATGGTSVATATGGNGGIGYGGTGFGGSANATGGSVLGSGNSNATGGSVVGSGNSANTNTNISNAQNKQKQGQNQGQTQQSLNRNDVRVEGDSTTNKVYANSWPSVNGAEGVSSGTASSIFGSLGMSSTEQYKKLMPQIQVISALVKDGTLSKEEGTKIINGLVKRMLKANKTQRFLGIFWETDSKSLANFLGLLSWDSMWDEGQNPFQSKSDMQK